jgi:hypothetical protein
MIVVPTIGHDCTSGLAGHALPQGYKATNVPDNICGQLSFNQLIMLIKEKMGAWNQGGAVIEICYV